MRDRPEEVEKVLFEKGSGKVSDDCWDGFLSLPIKNNKGFYVINVKGLSEIQGIIGDLQDMKPELKNVRYSN